MKKEQKISKVAIQGMKGSFHHEAADLFFKNQIEVFECDTFLDVFEHTNNGFTEFGVFAIENTVAGSLLENYRLLLQSKRKVLGEILLRVEQNLMGIEQSTLNEITEVYSHPMAIAQTREFFKDYKWIKLIESIDTAKSAEFIAQRNDKSKAAICSLKAGALHGLKTIQKGIETHKRNFTRFLIIGHHDQLHLNSEKRNKSSICFTAKHEVGSLSKVLTIFSFYGINLTKIQSLPILGKEWQYQFYVDLTFDQIENYENALTAVNPLVTDLTVLGIYPESRKVINELVPQDLINTSII